MTKLIDVHAPRYDVCESLVLQVDAAPADVLKALDRLDLGRDPYSGLETLGRTRRERLFRVSWQSSPSAGRHIEVVWDIRVEPGDDGESFLSSTRRFIAADDASRADLEAYWRHIRAAADTVVRTTLRTIKRAAEERSALTVVPQRAELLAA